MKNSSINFYFNKFSSRRFNFYPKIHQRKLKVIDLVHLSPFLSPPHFPPSFTFQALKGRTVIKATQETQVWQPYFLKGSPSKKSLVGNRELSPQSLHCFGKVVTLHPSLPSLTPGFTPKFIPQGLLGPVV